MSNKKYLVICVFVFVAFSLIDLSKSNSKFDGEIVTSQCVKTGKSEMSIELVARRGGKNRTFYFGVRGSLCEDVVGSFSPKADVVIYYSSLSGWFTDITKLVLDGREIPLRTYDQE